jgi:DNA helicase HerA-like ATPase
MKLFPRDNVVGVFRGFTAGGMEFHADLTIPYRPQLHNIPMHGQFVLVQLEHENEAVLGRITALSAMGRLASDSGEQYSIRAALEERRVDDDLREAFLRYRVDIRVLGVVRIDTDGAFQFVPSHRRLPHVGSPVAFPSDEILRHLVGHHGEGAELGFFALGEYVYAGNDERLEYEPWMQRKSPDQVVRFPIENLVSRRSFIFARAGFGKSNLNKLLFSTLYSTQPTVRKKDNRDVPVGTIIFDPDGEYFWPDDKGRPGLCDVPALENQVVVFTSREAPSPFYGSFVASGVRLDIRRLSPADVISIALSAEKQDQQNVKKLRQMNLSDWAELVDLIDLHGHSADLERIRQLLRLEASQDTEALAARGNVTTIVRTLHDRSSRMIDILLEALRDGKLCVVDISQLRGGPSMILAGLILRRIFDRNQAEFTKAVPQTVPTIVVIEEAQSVLDDRAAAAAPYIEWIKEGRKYDLGAVLITQQPGSIPVEILSQGDNWFIFHLLSESDLKNAQRANAHFSTDLLSSLLNEPIAGQGIFWSSAGKTKYPIPLRVFSFERLYERLDKTNSRPATPKYAMQLRDRMNGAHKASHEAKTDELVDKGVSVGEEKVVVGHDPLRDAQSAAIRNLGASRDFVDGIGRGIPWGRVLGLLKASLPTSMDDPDSVARALVPRALNELLGPQDVSWHTVRRGERNTLFVLRGPKPN